MKNLPFKQSKELSIGIELEFQLIHPVTFNLVSRAKDLIRNIATSPYHDLIKPEVTQSMIEINSSVHPTIPALYKELKEIRSFLLHQSHLLNFSICGGGAHPFQKWTSTKVFPTKRFKNLLHQYRYLTKRTTVFGQHIHIGCKNAEDALYLSHALGRYVPQLIAMSASSPFYEGIDTGFQTCRTTIFNGLPLTDLIPYLLTWQEFSNYFYQFKKLNLVKTMKDLHWDVRPKPEFGTVEIRVCDTPLTLEKAIMFAAYAQSLSAYLLYERPFEITKNLYYLYKYNRFVASRYGLEGMIIDPLTLKSVTIADDILATISLIKKHVRLLNNCKYIKSLADDVLKNKNDAQKLKEIYRKKGSLALLVQEQCKIWKK